MIVPDSIDVETQSDEEILERLQRDAGYDSDAAAFVLDVLRGRAPAEFVVD